MDKHWIDKIPSIVFGTVFIVLLIATIAGNS